MPQSLGWKRASAFEPSPQPGRSSVPAAVPATPGQQIATGHRATGEAVARLAEQRIGLFTHPALRDP